jgi:hypothetical protein
VTDRDRTLAAIRARRWRVVKLGIRTKAPVGKHWETTADADEVAHWLDTGHNIGLVCHQDTGVAVLDPDKIEWADMLDTVGLLPPPWVLTGSGRLHYYIAWTQGLPAKLTWQGKVIGEIQRGPGQQQVVLPPSIHPDTRLPYRWISGALLPEILCEPIDPVTTPLPPLPGIWCGYLLHDYYMRMHERDERERHRGR